MYAWPAIPWIANVWRGSERIGPGTRCMCRLVNAEVYGEAEETVECADEHLEDVRREF